MKLPNADIARIDRQKLEAYLLSAAHPIGRSKAKFFHLLGFGESNAAHLERALREVAQTGEIAAIVRSPHGVKYVVDGLLPAPSGDRVKLRTIWIIETGEQRPPFVTAYPV